MNNYGVVEFASTARHDGYGNMVEIFVISSVNASVTLVRKGVMRASGLDTKMRDVRLMDETALAAMKRSAVEGLTAQLLGIAELKHNREIAELEREKHNERAKLHNISLFMGQLTAIAERQTNTPDWGEW